MTFIMKIDISATQKLGSIIPILYFSKKLKLSDINNKQNIFPYY